MLFFGMALQPVVDRLPGHADSLRNVGLLHLLDVEHMKHFINADSIVPAGFKRLMGVFLLAVGAAIAHSGAILAPARAMLMISAVAFRAGRRRQLIHAPDCRSVMS
jgi:hypothetical protein